MDKLDKEYQYFRVNRNELLKQYKDKFIVIKDQKVVGSYSTEQEAYEDSVQKFELGTFLLQKCVVEDEEQKAVFHSRVLFA